MNNELFTNSDAINILEMPQRQIINLTEKSVVIPVVEARGAGSKRGYSYTNLLEFALASKLFEIDFGIHLVRKILSSLRESTLLEQWATNFEYLFNKCAEAYLKDIEGMDLSDDIKAAITKMSDNTRSLSKTPSGILFYIFHNDGSAEPIILPWKMEDIDLGPIKEKISASKATLVIDIGSIKDHIDKNIKALKG